jgi:hypothetical protein
LPDRRPAVSKIPSSYNHITVHFTTNTIRASHIQVTCLPQKYVAKGEFFFLFGRSKAKKEKCLCLSSPLSYRRCEFCSALQS